jgi:uncharacterized protein
MLGKLKLFNINMFKKKISSEKEKQTAAERHCFMESFLAQFYAEWEGVK